MSPFFKVIASALILLLLAALFLAETVPPRGLTLNRLTVTKRRILQYAHLHNKLPLTLAELPARPGCDNETTDAWQRPLDYRSDESGAVTLRSLGADRLPGGEGDNRDMTGVFMSRDAQNRWQEELAEWKLDPARP
ncbi:MAG: type II secretion system protein GspG [Prosthecobacter sp.]